MSIYLVNFEDVSHIQLGKKELIDSIEAKVKVKNLIYQSPYFVEGTGYAKTVDDEISLVLSSQQAMGLSNISKEKFISEWGFEKYANYEISALSGGWRKFLGLALFSIQQSNCKIYFDSFRQLSDRLISVFIENLKSQKSCEIFLFEYDADYIKYPEIKKVIYDGKGFLPHDTYARKTPALEITETNYE